MKAVKVFVLNKKGKDITLPFKPIEFFALDPDTLPSDCVILDEVGAYSTTSGMVLTRETAYLASSVQFSIYAELERL